MGAYPTGPHPTGPNDSAARRFLFSVCGGYGHLHPVMPLARALQQAGHAVAFAIGRSLVPLVEAAGFRAVPVGDGLAADPEYQRFQAERQTMPLGLDSELVIYTRIFCGISPRLRSPELVEIARTWQADALIREAGEYGAVIAAEHLGLPHITVSFAAALHAMTIFERAAAAQLDPIRQRWGLPPDPSLRSLSRYLSLAYTPPSFGTQAVGGDIGAPTGTQVLPATTHFFRPDFFDHAGPEEVPEWLSALPAQPTIYVTLGTEVNKEPGVYPDVLQAIVAGLRDARLNLIVTLGRDHDPADFGPQPANVHIERYIPHSLLLRRCDLMVMHGGSNSLLAALDVGIPLVVVPLIADQFFNAELVQRMHLGRAVPREHLTPASIRAAVEDVLANANYRRSVGRLQAEMHALPDQKHAVGLVERVVAQRAPVLNTRLAAPL